MKWNLNLLHFQQKKIRTLEKTVDSLKADNRLLTDEITGLHKMWMEQPAAVPSSKKPTKEEILNSEIILAQIEYSEGIEILPKEPKKTPIYRQETDFIDKSPL